MTQRSTSVILAQLMFSNSSIEYTIKKYHGPYHTKLGG